MARVFWWVKTGCLDWDLDCLFVLNAGTAGTFLCLQ